MTFDLDKETEEPDPDAVSVPSPYIQWQQVAEDSLGNPQAVLKVILTAKDFELAKRWARLHGLHADLREVSARGSERTSVGDCTCPSQLNLFSTGCSVLSKSPQ